jgi:hypothetical protein
VIAAECPTRCLQVHQPVAYSVTARDLTDDKRERRAPDRHGHFKLAQRTLEAVEVMFLIEDGSRDDPEHFIDGIGELQTAVFDMHAGPGM